MTQQLKRGTLLTWCLFVSSFMFFTTRIALGNYGRRSFNAAEPQDPCTGGAQCELLEQRADAAGVKSKHDFFSTTSPTNNTMPQARFSVNSRQYESQRQISIIAFEMVQVWTNNANKANIHQQLSEH